jgi:hypothetical protein
MAGGVEVVAAFTDTAIRAAITAVQAATGNQGGVVLLPPGSYACSATISIPSKITLQGAGKQTTILIAQGDIIVIDMAGVAGGVNGPGGINGHVASPIMQDMQVQGNNAAWTTAPMVRMAYVHTAEFNSVTFGFKNAVAFQILCEVWDSTWRECRWDNSGGTNTGKPAMLVYSADGTAMPGFGASSDATNDLRFYHCTWEGFKDGAFWAKAGQTGANPMGNFYFHFCKADQNQTCLGDWFRFEGMQGVFLHDFDLSSYQAGPTYAGTPFNMFTIQASKGVQIDGWTHNQNSGQTNSLIYFDGTGLSGIGNRFVTIGAIDVGQIGGATQAFAATMIVYKGTNLNYRFDFQSIPRYMTSSPLAIKPIFSLEAGTITYPTQLLRPISSKTTDFSDSSDIGTQEPGIPTGMAAIAGVNTATNKLFIRYPDATYHYATLT